MVKRRIIALAFGVVLVALLALLRGSDPFPLRVARETTFDFYQQLKPRADPQLPIRIIDIDEASLAQIGQWPWPRNTMATLARRLTELGAAAVAFDVIFAEPDRASPSADGGSADYDADFAAALAQGPTILGLSENAASAKLPGVAKAGFAISGADPLAALPVLTGAALPLPQLGAAASGLGVVSLEKGTGGGVVRRLPLLWSNGTTEFPALSVEALRIALGVSTLVVLGDTDGLGTVDALRIGDIEVPTGPSADIWLYYRLLQPGMSIPAKDMLADNYHALADRIAGHIVLIGASATGLQDVRSGALGGAVSGVSVHVQALEQMLSGVYLSRADWVGGLEVVLFAIAALAIVIVILLTGPIIGLLFSGMIVLVATAASWFAFASYGLLIDPSFPLLGALVVYAAMAFFQFAVTDADKRRIRSAFGYYVAPALLTQIENSAGELKLGGELRDLTVMFSDVRNFSSISERLEPARLVGLLNTVFGALGGQITGQFGTIDKFMGDAIMAFWNAPVDVAQHPLRACQAALGMRAALRALNQSHPDALGGEAVAIGIGIATGPALVGNMGLESRFDYSCIGETVNIASRIEGGCKTVAYDIVITAETRDAVSEFATLDAGALALKGISAREPIFILLGDADLAQSAQFLALKTQHEATLDGLRRGDDAEGLARSCAELAERIDPLLRNFYAVLPQRRDDFLDTFRA
ncbi:adenylate/guanylate cyclase domain-containing protein [Devosia sp.]|uniref:CHASE2 domain-containing protein n=1 Tax=Devosia sp. TaxID=1871048 RepID=UPI0032639590